MTVRIAPFGMDFVFSIYYLAAPLLLIDLKANPVQLGLVGTLAASVHMGMAHLMGHLSDRMGRRRLIIAAPVIFSTTCLLMTQVREVWIILALSVVNGFCLSIYWPSLQAWIADRQTGTGLARDIGDFNMSWTAATLAGPILSGVSLQPLRGTPLLRCGGNCPDAFSSRLHHGARKQASLSRKSGTRGYRNIELAQEFSLRRMGGQLCFLVHHWKRQVPVPQTRPGIEHPTSPHRPDSRISWLRPVLGFLSSPKDRSLALHKGFFVWCSDSITGRDFIDYCVERTNTLRLQLSS